MVGCGVCGRENPDGFQFCGFCGAPLVSETPPLAEVRKVVSVLFCDVVGFTSASETADPEDVRARMERYYAALRPEIERFGGTVEKFIGDAVMAVFGVPVAHEDDAERAVRAGLAVLEAVSALNEREPGLSLAVRVGVNTGEVVARDVGAAEGASVLGDVVNTAARIQSAALVNTVAVGERTFRETDRVFVYEELDPVPAKGKADPVSIYRAVEPRGRFGSDLIRTHTSPFVGRTVELTLLQGLFERAARDDALQLVTLVGEPGVGKSRLVAQLFEWVDTRPELVTWRQGRCLPYGEGITFWALSEIVKAQAGILESDPADVAGAKLEAVLPPGEAKPWLLARLLPLIGIDAGETASRDESFTAWRRFLELLPAIGPAVVVVEDLHWADEAMLDFLGYVAEWSEQAPLLLLCTARPELLDHHPGWAGGLRNAQTITLSPLSSAEMTELVEALVSQAVSEQALVRILERAGGNPFYAEEFVRLVADRGGVGETDTEAFPASLQALIAARLDALPTDARSLVLDAAVVGKVFWSGALAAVGELSANETERLLHELSRRELVRVSRQSSMEGEREYSFWHALVRDVAYAQIPRATRMRRHEEVARWIETKASDRVEDLAEVLAHHYAQALDLSTAVGDPEAEARLKEPSRRYLALAGERALGLDAARSERYFSRALTLTPLDTTERPRLLARHASALIELGRAADAAIVIDEAIPAATSNRDRGELLRLRSEVALSTGEGNFLDLAKAAVEALGADARDAILVDALGQLAFAHWVSGNSEEAGEAGEAALGHAASLGLSIPANAATVRLLASTRRDSWESPLEGVEDTLHALVDTGTGHGAARLLNAAGFVALYREGAAPAAEWFARAAAFSRERGILGIAALAEANQVEALVGSGRTDDALRLGERVIAEAISRGDANALGQARGAEVLIHTLRGEVDRALEIGAAAVEDARASGRGDVVATFAAYLSALVLAERREEARGFLDEIIHGGFNADANYVLQLPSLERSAVSLDEIDGARELLEQAAPERGPMEQACITTVDALLLESCRDLGGAVDAYESALALWRRVETPLEEALARLGYGRVLAAIGDARAIPTLSDAVTSFDEMGLWVPKEEAEGLLAAARHQATAPG